MKQLTKDFPLLHYNTFFQLFYFFTILRKTTTYSHNFKVLKTTCTLSSKLTTSFTCSTQMAEFFENLQPGIGEHLTELLTTSLTKK
jgi:hypothetical protein